MNTTRRGLGAGALALGLVGAETSLTAEQDHRRLLGLLGIDQLRPGADGRNAGPLTACDLPVDAHQLIALCAPRPVFISVGNPQADAWTDPRGMFMAAAFASPAWALLGARPMASDAFPPLGTLVDGDLAFRQHEGGHTGGPNWPVFLDWWTQARQ